MSEKRRTRSDKYQYLILEAAYSNDMLESFPNEESINKRLNPFDYNEEVALLEDQLKEEFWRIVETCLTDRQKEVIELCADGYTQMEISKILNVNQSSINKSLNGNVDYNKNKRVYGGSKKRIKKIAEEDSKIKEILEKINELRKSSY